ncbi:helix-turn-helix transcriptional regulator [Ekhidna sp.]|uniref:helix-turn-helix domain-containing protein n=1 Tax=Ekhidna sp. TaxID=2608089 RepID=UPI003297B787
MSLQIMLVFLTFVLMVQVRDKELISKIAQRLKALREEKGLTQEQLYNDLEIHVGRIESMKVNPTVSTINSLCKYFEISLAEFFDGIH